MALTRPKSIETLLRKAIREKYSEIKPELKKRGLSDEDLEKLDEAIEINQEMFFDGLSDLIHVA